ncbi:cbb3-type cytochrome c oxidase subunit II [Aequorivita sp. CIP111184]|uniref:cbb3-type cytochrome c oxidase subunit II n=1 Tax=Aequorivita sp. CIP111184 TaxID=2211356 RepID=UPI000DBBD16C|nr:cbb3-type cytochrome c oxidase subunit II [Aequorivita sp. CIP111184]SRX55125.1 Alcohol dehydrogenase cytochrome c subunit [Aequorivita sp. CIP111184]
MLNFHKEHKNLVLTAGVVFIALSIMVAILPAYQMQETQPIPNQKPLTANEQEGLRIYVSENCMACHTQQVRNIEMDNMWGNRPSIPSDYFFSKQRLDVWRQSPSLLGSERTGPDLTNIGKRQPSDDWHFLHLYNPRAVVSESVMPSYPWLFREVDSTLVGENDKIVAVPKEYFNNPGTKIVATKDALLLVEYLKSLKQMELPGGNVSDFIPALRKIQEEGMRSDKASGGLDGANLFKQTCAACHQDNGKGIAGAFPPLAGSKIVNDESPEMLIKIILQGYDARADYGVMPPFGDQLSDAEIAAITTHERSSWGNNAPAVKEEDVKKIREMVKNELNQ